MQDDVNTLGDVAYAIAVDNSGIYVGGNIDAGINQSWCVRKYLHSGGLDVTFSGNGDYRENLSSSL